MLKFGREVTIHAVFNFSIMKAWIHRPNSTFQLPGVIGLAADWVDRSPGKVLSYLTLLWIVVTSGDSHNSRLLEILQGLRRRRSWLIGSQLAIFT